MRLYYYVSRPGNFGDDLNRWLWPRLLPGLWDEGDGTAFSGVGTILTRAMPPARRWIVLGSGAGYGPPPDGFGGPGWNIVAVRGPLSAQVLGLPAERAVTDGAILLATLPELAPVPDAERRGTVFVPHFQALETGHWRRVAERAGVEFVDPRGDSHQVISRLRTARLVLADAMHAAIIADSMRVPWVPLTTSRKISSFKWLDWTSSMQVAYRPEPLPPTGLADRLRNATLGIYGERHALDDPTVESAMAHYRRQRRLKTRPGWPTWARYSRKLLDDAPLRLLAAPPFSRVSAPGDASLDRAAAVLRRSAAGTGYLSSPRRWEGACEQMRAGLGRVRDIVARPVP